MSTLTVTQIADALISGASDIFDSVSNSAKAEALAFIKGKPELYEFQMARYESGDRRLLNKMADREQNKDPSLSDVDAMENACTKFKHTEDLASGDYGFGEIRSSLKKGQ